MQRALLLLIGGRPIPNVLTSVHLKPDVIVPIASMEALRDGTWTQMEIALKQVCQAAIVEPQEVDAFDIDQVRTACAEAIAQFRDTEWFINVTSGTTIMSIGAYEVGRQNNASIWYLNTATRRVITLRGNTPNDEVYYLTVEDYLKAYGRSSHSTQPEPPSQEQVEFAKYLAERPHNAMAFRDLLRKAGISEGKFDTPRTVQLKRKSSKVDVDVMVDLAQRSGMLSSYEFEGPSSLKCIAPSDQLWHFMNGLWLEIFAWSAAAAITTSLDDYRYALCIPSIEGGENELDLAITCAASLVIVECKTEAKPFDTAYLDKLQSIASMVGGNFVGRIFIASKLSNELDRNQQKEFENFCNQAARRQVVVVAGEDLINLSQILKREANTPTYARR